MLRAATKRVSRPVLPWRVTPGCPACLHLLASSAPRPTPSSSTPRLPTHRSLATQALAEKPPSQEDEAPQENQPPSLSSLLDKDLQVLFSGPLPPPTTPTLATPKDFDSLRPDRSHFSPSEIREAASTMTNRILYTKAYDEAYHLVHGAFHKRDLRVMLVDEDLGDQRLREGVRMSDRAVVSKNGRRKPVALRRVGKPVRSVVTRWVKQKVAMYTKGEMIKALLCLRWGMPDPEALGNISGESTIEFYKVKPKIVFLLLTPNAPYIAQIRNRLNVEISFDGETTLQLKGNKGDIEEAKVDLEEMKKTAKKRNINLPINLLDIQPEVYQAISGMSCVFITPKAGHPRTLHLTATEHHYLDKAQHLIHKAVVHHNQSLATPLFLSSPSSPTSEVSSAPLYALFPHASSLSPPWTAGSSSPSTIFSRLRAVSPSSSHTDTSSPSSSSSSNDEITLLTDTPRNLSDREGGLSLMETALKEFNGEKNVQVKVGLGHVLFPKHAEHQVLEGPLELGEFESRLSGGEGERGGGVKGVFVPSAPPSLLSISGVLTPLARSSDRSSSSASSPSSEQAEMDAKLERLFPGLSSAPLPTADLDSDSTSESDSAVEMEKKEEAPVASLVSESGRTIVYSAVDVKMAGEEIVLHLDAQGRTLKRERRRRKVVHLLLPDSPCDLQVVATATSEFDISALPLDQRAFFLSTSTSPLGTPRPSFVSYNSLSYVLTSSTSYQSSTITPPSLNALPIIYSRTQSDGLDASRGLAVSLLLPSVSEEGWKRAVESVRELVGRQWSVGQVGIDEERTRKMVFL